MRNLPTLPGVSYTKFLHGFLSPESSGNHTYMQPTLGFTAAQGNSFDQSSGFDTSRALYYSLPARN